jgi:hypothetical protein
MNQSELEEARRMHTLHSATCNSGTPRYPPNHGRHGVNRGNWLPMRAEQRFRYHLDPHHNLLGDSNALFITVILINSFNSLRADC